MKAAQIIASYDELLNKASEIVSFYSDQYTRLHVNGDTAWVSMPSAHSSYGDCVIETDRSREFPTYLLDAEQEEVKRWKKSEADKDYRARKKQMEKNEEEKRSAEIKLLVQLKEKYEK